MRGPLGDLRPAERRGAMFAFLTIFGILAGHTLLETARDALFLARLPASQLPWVYLAIAGVAIGLSQWPWRPRRGRRYALSLLLGVSSVVTFVFWATHSATDPWALRALYVWTGLLGTLAALQFWLVLGEIYTVTEARRVFRLVGTGSVLGAIAGAGAARVITQFTSARHLILASAVVLALTALGPALRVRRPRRTVGPASARAGGPLRATSLVFAGDPYVKALGGLVLISTVALTLTDYVFKSTVARLVAPEQLGQFFAGFYMVLNVLALLAQTLLLGWSLRVLGLHRTLWVLPAFVFLGAAGVALGGGLMAALLLKGADGTLRYSFHRTGTELLFVPLSDALRSRAKPVIDVVGQRGGQAVASLLILAEITQHRGSVVLAMAAGALALLWIGWTAELRGLYLNLFRSALRTGSMRGRPDLPALDLGSLETLIRALNSGDDGEVTGAMELLAEEGRARLIPALILYHPSCDVVLRALELLADEGRTDFVPVADRLLDHADERVRAAALLARTRVAKDEAILRRAMADPSPTVSATAVVGLVSGGWAAPETGAMLECLLDGHHPRARIALAAAIRAQPSPAFEAALLTLSESGDEEVLFEVASAIALVRTPALLPTLLPLLASQRLRGPARAAFLAYGPAGLAFLNDALSDESLPQELRRHVPRAVSRFPAEEAAPVLVKRLLAERDGMVRYRILRGLGRLAADHPDLKLDREILRRATEATLEVAFRVLHWRQILVRGAVEVPRRATPGHEVLVALLGDKEKQAVERLFRLLGLQYRGEDFEEIYRGLANVEPKVRAGSRELMDNVLEDPLREAVLALVDEIPDRDRLLRAGPYYRSADVDYEAMVARLLGERGETVQCLAAAHAGELGLAGLRPRLESLREGNPGFFLLKVVERALEALGPPPRERLSHVG